MSLHSIVSIASRIVSRHAHDHLTGPRARWQDILSLLLGLWLFLAPWIGRSITSVAAQSPAILAADWNSCVLGPVIFFAATVALLVPVARFPEWVAAASGLWLFPRPWLFGYGPAARFEAWDQWIIGAVVLAISVAALKSLATR